MLLLSLSCPAEIPVQSSIAYQTGASTNQILLTWEAIPSKLYNVLSATDLGQQPWQLLTPAPIYASNNLIKFLNSNDQSTRFYKVVKVDTDPPEIWRMTPGSNAIAIARESAIKIWIRDETEIDPSSISLAIGSNPPMMLPSPRLTYLDGLLTYSPATNQFLGTNGQIITNTLVVADTLGHRITNQSFFRLELMPIFADNVVVISNSSALTLVSVLADTFVFSYTGDSSGLIEGQIIVSTDSDEPYNRRILSISDDLENHMVTLETELAALADVFAQGSVHFSDGNTPSGASAARAGSAVDGTTINLGGTDLYDDGNVTIRISSGRFFFDRDLSISADFDNGLVFNLDAWAGAALDLTLQASWQNSRAFEHEKRIGSSRRRATKLVRGIPIVVETEWEFYLGVKGEVAANASVTTAIESSTEVAFGARLRLGSWTPYGGARPPSFQYETPAWQGSGSGYIRAYVDARLTVLLYGVAGPAFSVTPYLELQGNTCVQPGQAGVDRALFGGIDGTLAMDVRGWDANWWDFPSWDIMNVRRQLWHDTSAIPTGQALQTIPNMVWIPCGTFTMGSPVTEPSRQEEEGPLTQVKISQGFWMKKHEVTQREYASMMGNNPSWYNGIRIEGGQQFNYGTNLERPVEQVSWNDAVAYCAALTETERAAGRLPVGYVYRLPTEAEWEYACRAGSTTPFNFGSILRAGMAAFYDAYEYPPCDEWLDCFNPERFGNSPTNTLSVGSYAPNAWGLFDMHGNVLELCQDRYDSYPGGSVVDPQGAAVGMFRVCRGGHFQEYPSGCRSAARTWAVFEYLRAPLLGFRVVLAPGYP